MMMKKKKAQQNCRLKLKQKADVVVVADVAAAVKDVVHRQVVAVAPVVLESKRLLDLCATKTMCRK